MNCNKTNKLIDVTDFDCIGQLAIHCDKSKLCIAIQEAQDFDLEKLFCAFWLDILENYNNNNELWEKLMCGGVYLSCNGTNKRHYGIKRILVYYAYSRYLLINSFNDTASGTVQHTHNYSIPTPLKEIQSFSDKYRSMAYDSYKNTVYFLCKNKDYFKNFNSKDCKSCGCSENCENKTKAKGYGFKGSIIRKVI